ncbi:MAG: rhodanese-like domain-containing protein [Defluviitaleaceae bacterium]|nr:rhodanese-like domain-containing protein [Defluviitaleaceae bacterium]
MATTMTLQQLEQLNDSNCQLIDIRTPYEYARGHASKAINIPYDLLMMYPESYLKQGMTYYLICAHGSLSHRAGVILRSYGYNVSNVENGYHSGMRYGYY